MGKGGLAVVGWVLLGVGGLLVYAGMTGQSLAGELQSILAGKSPKAPPAPATPASDGKSGLDAGNGAAGSGGSGGGGGSW